MNIEIINQQKIKRIDVKYFKKHLKKASRLLNLSSKKISLILCDNNFIKKLNRRYFKKYKSTDVISFPLEDALEPNYLGEVVVSVEEALRASAKLDLEWKSELLLYMIHGILHLTGYKDRTKRQKEKMRSKEEEIIKKLSL